MESGRDRSQKLLGRFMEIIGIAIKTSSVDSKGNENSIKFTVRYSAYTLRLFIEFVVPKVLLHTLFHLRKVRMGTWASVNGLDSMSS